MDLPEMLPLSGRGSSPPYGVRVPSARRPGQQPKSGLPGRHLDDRGPLPRPEDVPSQGAFAACSRSPRCFSGSSRFRAACNEAICTVCRFPHRKITWSMVRCTSSYRYGGPSTNVRQPTLQCTNRVIRDITGTNRWHTGKSSCFRMSTSTSHWNTITGTLRAPRTTSHHSPGSPGRLRARRGVAQSFGACGPRTPLGTPGNGARGTLTPQGRARGPEAPNRSASRTMIGADITP
jgi:hypothetical protein